MDDKVLKRLVDDILDSDITIQLKTFDPIDFDACNMYTQNTYAQSNKTSYGFSTKNRIKRNLHRAILSGVNVL